MNTAAAQSYRLKRALVLASAECDRLTFITQQSSSGTRPAINTNCQTIKPHTLILAVHIFLLRYLRDTSNPSILAYNFVSFCLQARYLFAPENQDTFVSYISYFLFRLWREYVYLR